MEFKPTGIYLRIGKYLLSDHGKGRMWLGKINGPGLETKERKLEKHIEKSLDEYWKENR